MNFKQALKKSSVNQDNDTKKALLSKATYFGLLIFRLHFWPQYSPDNH